MRKVFGTLAAAIAVMLCLSACSTEPAAVPVQRADLLTATAQAQDRYPGMVVSQHMTTVSRDMSKTIQDLYVTEGQDVHSGDLLFSYDVDALQLDLEKMSLELEKLQNALENAAAELEDLQKKLENAYYESDRIALTIQINNVKTQQLEDTYTLAAKEKDIAQLEEMLVNVDVVSPVDGRVRKIDDQAGDTGAYITIQESGAFRVKGTLNEMSMSGGIYVGAGVRVISRIDQNLVWTGFVSMIDTENNEDNQNNGFYYGPDNSMSTASKYPFYVELDSTDGLLMGQHVYIEVVNDAASEMEGLWIPASFLSEISETYPMTATVFAANSEGKLEKRTVSLSFYNDMTDSYAVAEGLNPDDYVADPAAPGCAEGAAVEYRSSTDFTGGEAAQP